MQNPWSYQDLSSNLHLNKIPGSSFVNGRVLGQSCGGLFIELEIIMCFLRVCMLIFFVSYVCMHVDTRENKGLLLKVDVFLSLYPAY